MVIGDDRGQTAVVADDFRAAGLGHLLVVSGQNVAFVLAVVAPFAGRFRPAFRALWLFATLLLFAVITRFEPSVLRAVAMAGAGIGASVMGTPIDGKRALSWAVAGLLLIDPFLVHLVAFQLSVAATAGIVWWSGPLAERFVGPGWLRVPMATTAAAQLAVSPVLLGLFGPLPLGVASGQSVGGSGVGRGDGLGLHWWNVRRLLRWIRRGACAYSQQGDALVDRGCGFVGCAWPSGNAWGGVDLVVGGGCIAGGVEVAVIDGGGRGVGIAGWSGRVDNSSEFGTG